MKRLFGLVGLMLLTTSADAGQISFSVGGHRVRIEAPRHCRSASCASVSVSGVYNSRRRDRDEDTRDVAPPPPPAPAPAPAQVSPPSAPPLQAKPIIAAAPPPPPAVSPPASTPAVGFATASISTQAVAAPPLPPVPPPPVQPTVATQPCVAPEPKPIEASPSPPPAKPPVQKALHEEESSDTPLGDWQTESKGVVRIAQCGKALCGYAINASSDDKGEAVLINMKPKTDSRWTGSVYSKDSGDTYYGTVNLKGPNTLRVEACAFSRFYCTGNNWIRISAKPMVTSRQVETRPRS